MKIVIAIEITVLCTNLDIYRVLRHFTINFCIGPNNFDIFSMLLVTVQTYDTQHMNYIKLNNLCGHFFKLHINESKVHTLYLKLNNLYGHYNNIVSGCCTE